MMEYLQLAIVALLAASTFTSLTSHRSTWCREWAVAWLVVMIGVYAFCRFSVMSAFDEFDPASWWQWSFAITEGSALLHDAWISLVLRKASNHSPAADEAAQLFNTLDACDRPSVAIFVPIYDEPIALVKFTIADVGRIASFYGGRAVVYCLDDGRHPTKRGEESPREKACKVAVQSYDPDEVQHFCDQLAIKKLPVRYLARRNKRGAKAGNLSFAFRRTTEEYIAVIDCDFHLSPHFLPRTVGLLRENATVGLVQVPQCFHNPDPIAHNLLAGNAICDTQASFMNMLQSCRDYSDNAFCVGSGWIARRSAIREIRGFGSLKTLAEDLELSYKLKLVGFRTLFLNEKLAFGLAPESLPEFLGQTSRWCFGTLQQLGVPSGPIFGKHQFVDRLFYFDPVLYWLTHLATAQILLAPVLFTCFGIESIPDPEHRVLGPLLLLAATRAVLQCWLNGGITLPVISAVSRVLAAFPISTTILLWLLGCDRPFRVTGKLQERNRIVVRWMMFSLFAALFAVCMIGMSGAFLSSDRSPVPIIYSMWSGYVAILSFLAMLVCIELPTPHIEILSSKTVEVTKWPQALWGIVKRAFGFAQA